jgi:uncharacterized protein with GYD domain
MATYVVLARFTDQGVKNAKDSPKRAEAFRQMAETFGVTVKDIFWTQGRYDIVIVRAAWTKRSLSRDARHSAKMPETQGISVTTITFWSFLALLERKRPPNLWWPRRGNSTKCIIPQQDRNRRLRSKSTFV